MNTGRVTSVIAALALTGGAALAAAPSASADQIWHQGVGRASSSALCPTTSTDETDAGWSDWQPSWDTWANDGQGGFVCARSNTWLRESTDDSAKQYPGGGCVKVQNLYVNFKGGWSLPTKSTFYADGCTTKKGGSTVPLVFAPSGWDAAELCHEAFGTWAASPTPAGQGAYWCGKN